MLTTRLSMTTAQRLVIMTDINMPSGEEVEGEIKQMITHDFVLDVYEKSLSEQDPEKRLAIVETAKILSQNIGTYLVDNN